jgi:catechol 2,3-dioxygenase-like lactoylglutathione lyase family enzyme
MQRLPAALGASIYTCRMFRFEHVAFNVPDVHATVKWFCDTLDLTVIRQQDVPPHMTFVADQGRNMMFEFYSNPTVPVYSAESGNDTTLHVAFHVDDMDAARSRLLAAGATARGDVATTPAGDRLAFLLDPAKVVVIQLVQRKNKML